VRRLVFLLFAVVVSALGFWKLYSSQNQHINASPNSSSLEVFLVPDLAQKSSNLRKVQISNAQKQVTLFSHDGKSWQVQERYGFPVDMPRLRQLLINLADAKRLEQKTDDAERMKSMDLHAEKATHLKLQTASATILDIFLGNSKNQNSYIRMADEKAAYRVSNILVASAEPALWLAPEFISLAAEEIKSMKFIPQAEKAHSEKAHSEKEFTLLRDKSTKSISLEKLPWNRDSDQAKLAEPFKALDNLAIVDVLPISQLTGKPQKFAVTIKNWSDVEIDIKFYDMQPSFLTISAQYAPEDKNIAASFAAMEQINKINKLGKDWAFRIAPQRENLLSKRLEDMLLAKQ